jgi:hypothetical protein
MNSLFIDIGTNVNTDKITHHGYDRFYPDYIKRDIKKLLEIGVEDYCSIKLWLEYCPNAFIYGFDIKTELNNERVKVIRGDQSNEADLNNLIINVGNNIDVIIDDGSHVPVHQILTFIKLFPSVINGGVYIIEDIETSYWKNNKPIYYYNLNEGINSKANLINVFSNALHLINREFINNDEFEIVKNNSLIPLELIDTISTITFGQNCIIIKKKMDYEYKYNNRKYRFS